MGRAAGGSAADRNEGLIIDVVQSKAGTFDSIADVSIAATSTDEVLAADSTRREAIITNLSGNVETLRVGDSGAGATNGTPLSPGSTLILATTAVIHAHNPGAAAQSVAVATTKD